jgi:hypothetical protein
MKIAYIEKTFHQKSMDLINICNGIIDDYQSRGYTLTLRQLYYQLVSRDIIPNKQKEYSRLGSIVSDARLAGLISWNAIEDRTRNVKGNSHWDNPKQIVEAAINSYRIDKWENQPYHVEVWVEKDALVGVISRVCSRLDVSYFSCRGYTSASEMWKAGYYRMEGAIDNGKQPVIIHLGDHDPSGIDMTRDIAERLALFSGYPVEVNRIALNMDQVRFYNPPPNPAKLTDSRADGYIQIHGYESWELDALDPDVLSDLIEDAVLELRDEDLWQDAIKKENKGIAELKKMIGEQN